MSFSVYYSKDYFDFKKEDLNYVAWFNIGIFSTILFSNLAIDMIG